MQTDKIKVYSSGKGKVEALDEAEKFAAYMGLSRRNAGRVRLLTEETLGMVEAIVENFMADFWIESTDRRGCRIHLTAEADVNYAMKQELISVSSRRENAAADGFMGRLLHLFENAYLGLLDKVEPSGSPIGMGGICELASMQGGAYLWSLEQYREELDKAKDTESEAEKEWNDLEKSIVAKLADDIRVSVLGDKVELVIEKNSFSPDA